MLIAVLMFSLMDTAMKLLSAALSGDAGGGPALAVLAAAGLRLRGLARRLRLHAAGALAAAPAARGDRHRMLALFAYGLRGCRWPRPIRSSSSRRPDHGAVGVRS
jgi:hypothetical protein